MSERKINVELFKKIIDYAKKDLRRLEMQVWGVRKNSDYMKYLKDQEDILRGRGLQSQWAACSTKACCAGWAVLLSTPKSKWKSWFKKSGEMKEGVYKRAQTLLGLDECQAEDIFRGSGSHCDRPKDQLKALREDINRLLEINQIEDRV
jgi:hypothetical protein